MYDQPEIDIRDWLKTVTDPEDRARYAREFGLTDRWHWSTPSMCAGGGLNASINASITGAKGSARRTSDDEGQEDA